ncbi:response regulator [Nibricoccus sp. IMCC34717]|uniref:response regulator n=1 Tax=Nibricoccus sp. IMCC34717 TaxID=3034021 RepID=UPI00384D898D
MDFTHAILRSHVDLATFASLVLLGLLFCQLVIRSSQVGGSLPRRNVIATLLVAAITLGATFGLSRLFEGHQRAILDGVLSSATADLRDAASTKGLDAAPIPRIAERWAKALPSLQNFQIQRLVKDRKAEVIFDSSAKEVSASAPSEAAVPVTLDSPAESGLAAYYSKDGRQALIRLSAFVSSSEGGDTHLVLNFRAGPWCTPVAVARVISLLSGLCIITLLLARPCLKCIHEAELQRHVKVEESLKQAREVADTHSRKKGELLAAMTYEIRTPLTAIMGFSRVLLDSELDAVQQRHVETIVSAGDRLAGLLNDILDLTKIEEGKLSLEQIDYSPIAVLNEVIDVMTSRATKKGVSLRLETPLRESFVTRGDPTRVRQVVQRLVDNALKFTERGAVTVRASWRPSVETPAEGILTLSIADTGVGISAERLPKLLESLQSPETSSTNFTGPGLSLVMVKRLVDLMQGKIEIQSTVNVGTTATLQVPCSPKSTVTQPGDFAPTRPPISSRRALVVDDQALNREIVRLMLQRLGFVAEAVPSGEEAVRLAQTQSYDIIFLDIDMPGLDGFATCAQLRALGGDYRLIPIVAVTGITEKGTRERCLVAGMSEYLTKPVYAPALKSTIAAVLQDTAS